MARIALIWELGSDLGHIARLLPIALALRERGHQPWLVLRDVSQAHGLLAAHQLPYLQAPVWLPPVVGLPPELNFTETLFRFGYLDPAGLLSMLTAWRQVLALVQAELLVLDHAPTANLAARGLDLPRLLIGNSFAVPPPTTPLPPYRWWLPHDTMQQRLLAAEAKLLGTANTALRSLGALPLRRVSELFDATATLICGRPALDVYGPRPDACYIGPVNNLDIGSPPEWPAGNQPKLFAYLKPPYHHFDAVLKALAGSGLRSLVYAPGLSPQAQREHHHPLLTLSTQPWRMRDARQQADFGICHAGGTTDVLLEAGKPALLLPMQMEQTMTARRAEATGACLHLPVDAAAEVIAPQIQRLVTDASLVAGAHRYAQALQSTPDTPVVLPVVPPAVSPVEQIVQTCEHLLGRP